MGKMLQEIYKIVTSKKGFQGRLKLAEITGISRADADEIDDTPALIEKVKKIASDIIGDDIEKFLNR